MKKYILILVALVAVAKSCKELPQHGEEFHENTNTEVVGVDDNMDIYANPTTFSNIKKLKIGAPAPSLKVDKWYNSPPINEFEPGTVYIVEFWASWCQPCRKSIPHLNKLQKEFRDDLTIIGLAASETKDSKSLEKLLFSKKENLTYAVGFTNDKDTFKNYMWAANNTGLPWTFIIDKKGKIVWWGQPFFSQFESVLRSVIKDTYIAKVGEVPSQADSNKMKEYWSIQETFWSAYGGEDWDKTIALGSQLQKANSELFYYEMATVFEVLFQYQNRREEALVFARQLENGLLSNIPEGLYAMSSSIYASDNLSDLELKYGSRLADKVVDLTLNENSSAKILQAKFLLKSGDTNRASKILKDIRSDDVELMKEIEKTLLKISESENS